jgi:hypothetical protein
LDDDEEDEEELLLELEDEELLELLESDSPGNGNLSSPGAEAGAALPGAGVGALGADVEAGGACDSPGNGN